MNGKSDNGKRDTSQFFEGLPGEHQYDLTQALDYDLDDPFDMSAGDLSSQFPTATEAKQVQEAEALPVPEVTEPGTAASEPPAETSLRPESDIDTDSTPKSFAAEFELDENEFSEAFDKTLSSTTLALRQRELDRVENPGREDLEDPDLAVKWLRKGLQHADPNSTQPVTSAETSNGSRSFRILALLASAILAIYFLATRTDYLAPAFALLRQ